MRPRGAFASTLLAAAALFALPVGGAVAAAPVAGASVFGLWLTDTGDGVIEVYRCGGEVCGRIVGMDYSGRMPVDYRHVSKCGLTFIYGMRQDADGDYVGHLFNPDSGSVYSARLRSVDADRVTLRGYVGIPLLGGSKTWTRYRGSIGAECRMRASG